MATVSWKDKQIFSEDPHNKHPHNKFNSLRQNTSSFKGNCRGFSCKLLTGINWWQNQTTCDFFLSSYVCCFLFFPSSNLLLLCSSVQGHCCKAVWIWNHIKGGTHQPSPGLLKYVIEVVCTWSHHQHKHRELARWCQVLLKQLLWEIVLTEGSHCSHHFVSCRPG